MYETIINCICFRPALLSVWEVGVLPTDCALHVPLRLLPQIMSQTKVCGKFRTSESIFLLLIKELKIYTFTAFATVRNTDGKDCITQIVLIKSVALPERIFVKLNNIQQHHVQTSYKYYLYWVDLNEIYN
jgi:hypothetical protein